MIELLNFWYIFPIAIIISTIAMMSGIGGALFFSPLFLVVLKIEPKLALATSLFIEIFGFGSGLIGYFRAKSINFYLVKKLIFPVIFSSLIGVLFASLIPSIFLKIVLILLLFYLSFKFLIGEKKCNPIHRNKDIISNSYEKNTKLKVYHYPIFSFGGFLVGLISSGLGEVNEYMFLKKFKLPLNFASGTSVFLVAVGAISGVIAHFFQIFFFEQNNILLEVVPILIFAIPGVILGAQLGVTLTLHLKIKKLEIYMGLLFLLIGLITTVSILI